MVASCHCSVTTYFLIIALAVCSISWLAELREHLKAQGLPNQTKTNTFVYTYVDAHEYYGGLWYSLRLNRSQTHRAKGFSSLQTPPAKLFRGRPEVQFSPIQVTREFSLIKQLDFPHWSIQAARGNARQRTTWIQKASAAI